MDDKSIKDRWERAYNMMLLLSELSKINRDKIREIQLRCGFTEQRRTRIHILDSDRQFDISVEDGKFIIHKYPWEYKFGKPPEVEVVIQRLCVIKHLRQGCIYGKHPTQNTTLKLRYAPIDSWSYGDVRAFGPRVTNDLKVFMDLFTEIITLIPEDKVVKVVGKCIHEE